jgi:hypothetical protein
MLDVKQDRLDYGRLLIPPENYQLNRGVATSYSLNLNTLLSIPVALFYAQTLEGDLTGERFQVLESIQKIASTVTVYIQNGCIHVPEKYNRLYSFIEDMIVPVQMGNAFSSFHPKVWVLRYEAKDNSKDVFYRAIVLSRNLTYDRSWDVAVSLEGRRGKKIQHPNQPLVDFIGFLSDKQAFPESEKFLDDLRRVEFEVPNRFNAFSFHPMGIPGYEESPIKDHEATNALCMSPFLSGRLLKQIRGQIDEDFWLLSRKQELNRQDEETLSLFKTYCLSDLVVDGERLSDVEEGIVEVQEQDLHAKVFVFSHGRRANWYLGSANATSAAFEKNVEFVLGLESRQRAARLEKLIEELISDEEQLGIFERFEQEDLGELPPEEETSSNQVRKLEFDLLNAPIKAGLTLSENQENYDLQIEVDLSKVSFPDGYRVTIHPFCIESTEQSLIAEQKQGIEFQNINETNISKFVTLSISHRSEMLRRFLIRLPLENIPPNRLNKIFQSIVNSRDRFFAYLAFLLNDEVSKEDLLGDMADKISASSDSESRNPFYDMPIYEQLLVAASRNPTKLKEIDRVLERLMRMGEESEEEVVPSEFLSFWESFKTLVETKKR